MTTVNTLAAIDDPVNELGNRSVHWGAETTPSVASVTVTTLLKPNSRRSTASNPQVARTNNGNNRNPDQVTVFVQFPW